MGRTKTSTMRKLSMYGFELVEGSHNFHGLLDFDITDLRPALRRARTAGSGGSLFSFLLVAIGKCLEEYPELNAMIDRRRTTVFDEVDMDIPIEIVVDGSWSTKQHIVRDINAKKLKEVDEEIEKAKRNEDEDEGYLSSGLARKVLGALPRGMVLFFFRTLLRNHELVKRFSGTVFVTSVSMFSSIPGYVIPYSGGPKAVSFAIGSAVKKPVVRGNRIEIREMLNVTAIFNHDIVDGAPAARFINRLRAYIEKDYGELL